MVDFLISKKGTLDLTIISEFITIIGTAIYLEFIELEFCGLDYYLKEKIRNRSISELTELSSFEEEIEDLDDD